MERHEKLRGNCSQLLALFEHYFEILSTFFFASTFFRILRAQSGKAYLLYVVNISFVLYCAIGQFR